MEERERKERVPFPFLSRSRFFRSLPGTSLLLTCLVKRRSVLGLQNRYV